MKNSLLFTVFTAGLLFTIPLYAQYCGGASGSSICTASTTFNTVGFEPPDDSLPCIIIGQPYSEVIQLHTPANATVGGATSTLNYIKIDTISNLPCDICWAMGKADFEIDGNATGCIKFSGTTFDAPGEYLLHIIVDENVTPFILPQTYADQNLAAQGLIYYVRVQLPNDTCTRIDTLVAGNTASHSGTLAAPAISGNTSICSGSSTTLTATGSNIYAYSWSNGTFNSSITVSSAGTYTVTVYGECTSATASKTITVLTVRDTISAGGATTFCQGGSVTLSVPSGSASYLWSNSATTNTISATATGTYIVTVTGTNGCSAASAGFNVTVNALPPDTISASGSLTFCTGGSVTLTGPGGLTYLWSNSATTQSITVSQSGNYALIVTNANNCSAVSAPVKVTLATLPDDTVTANGPVTFCPGSSVTLSGASGLEYHWSNGATTRYDTITQAGSYTLTVSNASAANCSAVSVATVVTVNNAPIDIIYAGGPVSFCAGDSVALTADPGVTGLTFNWNNGASTQTISVKQAGSYIVTVTNSYNCSAVSSPTSVTINAAPSDTVTIGGPTTFCSGGNVVLTASAGTTYHWSNNATSRSITVTQTGNYTVTITNANNCSAVSTPVAVTVNANPDDTVKASGPITFCSGGNVTLAAATGLTYKWSNNATTQAITVSQSGSYIVTVTNANNCSAVSPVTVVTVNASPGATITANGPTTFCSGGSVTLTAASAASYLWSNNLTSESIPVTMTGSYSVTVTGSDQCTAASSATVVVVNSATAISTQPASQVSCINGAVTFNVVASGDDITYQWQKNGVNINGQTSASYTISQATLSDTGNYRVIVTGICGIDTSHIAALSVTGSLTFSQQPNSQTACLGSGVSFAVVANGANTTFQWLKNGQNITNANSATYLISSASAADTGAYTCYVTSSCGDATSDSALLTIEPTSASSFSKSICTGSHYDFNGRSLSAAGTYLDTLTNHNGCDSIVTLNLTLTPPLTYIYYDSICAGTAYNFNGQNLTAAGVYIDTLITSGGCDSIITLHLSLKQALSSNSNAAICQGEVYNFNGQALTATGTYQATLTGADGCDSIAYLHLTVNQPSSATINVAICPNQSYNFNGHIITAGGTYADTLTNVLGCDSFVTLNLTNITTVTHTYNAAICSGSNYDFNSYILTAAGSYSDTLINTGGCDSIVTVNLTVNQASASSFSASVCAGAGYAFAGHTLSASGIYYDTLANRFGCDSIVTLNLTVDTPITTTIHAAICNGATYTFNGQHLNASGTYHANLTAHNGCDSTVTLVLVVNSFVTGSISAAICAGSSYNFNGRQLTNSGNYTDTLTAQGGCDSIVILNLSVNQATAGSIHAAICAGGRYYFNGQNLTTPGNYTETLTGSNGCDSVVTLTLQTAPFVTTAINGAICAGSSYNFNGRNLTTAGVYSDTLTALGGCDSIVTLTLKVNQTTDTTIYALICAGSTYLFNGTQIGGTGTYFEALTGGNGCDSIVRLQLTVNTLLTVNTSANICYGSSYNFNGRILTATGAFIDTLTARGGCDSVVTLNLTVDSLLQTALSDSICTGGAINFNGHSLTHAGTYIDTLQSIAGCDSIVTLTLGIKTHSNDTVIATVTQTAFCEGDSAQLCATPGYAVYDWSNHDTSTCFYTGSAGSYAVTVTDFIGCTAVSDSVILTVYSHAPASITEAGDTLTGSGAVSYQWYLNNQLISGDTANVIIAVHSGDYTVEITDSNGCHNTSSVTHVNTVISDITSGYGVKLYPNPSTGYFTLEFTDDVAREIEITDAIGNAIITYTKVERQKNFNLESLPAGVYFLRILQYNEVKSLKFSVVK